MTHLVFVAPFPPPIFGAARSSENVFTFLLQRASRHTIAVANMSGGTLNARSPIYHLRRMFGFFTALTLLIQGRFHRQRACYICAAAGYGMLYDLATVSIARLLGTNLFLHHRSFRYIDRKSQLMALSSWLGGSRLTHIFLCETMAAGFRRQYPNATRSLIVSNAFYNPPASMSTRREPGMPLRLGLLSNLCHEKGLDDFLALLDEAVAEDISLQGILAGAPFNPAAQQAIENALARLGGRIEWRGAITDENAKDSFFDEIDVFVFPTRYENEAQPIVVFEALSRGLPTIAFGRGCIPSDLGSANGMVIGTDDDFTTNALSLLRDLTEKPELWRRMSAAAIACVDAAHRKALAQFEAMTCAMLSDFRGFEE